MKRSEAILKIQDILMELDHSVDASLSPAEQLLEQILKEGFPIPCNKRGKFEWDLEVQDETK